MPQQSESADDGGRTEDLIARARLGDEVAWYTLYERYRKRLIIEIQQRIPGFARRRFEAFDVLQLAFMKAHSQLHTFQSRGEGTFRRWLRVIVFNEFHNLLRQNDREREHCTTESQGGDLGELVDKDEDGRPDAAPRRAELMASIEKLPEEDRELVIMVHLEKLSFSRIAEILECSRDKARADYERAFARLQRLIA